MLGQTFKHLLESLGHMDYVGPWTLFGIIEVTFLKVTQILFTHFLLPDLVHN